MLHIVRYFEFMSEKSVLDEYFAVAIFQIF